MVRLKECRIAAGMTQQYVALTLGVKAPSVSNWESGKTLPTADNLIALANLYGVTIDYLLGRDVDSAIKKETPPAMAEGEAEVSFSFPTGDEAAFDAGFDAAVREIVRQELSRRGIE